MSRADDTRFDSWKEIAAYLGRDLRTVRRWEGARGLPVHRVPGGGRSAIYAFRSEVDAWLLRNAGESFGSSQVSAQGVLKATKSPPTEITPENGKEVDRFSDHKVLHTPERVGGVRVRPYFTIKRVALVVITMAVALGASLVWIHRNGEASIRGIGPEAPPHIASVSPVTTREDQIIVIRGSGFGLHVPFSHTDTPFLAFRDKTSGWAAGRIIPQNWDAVMVNVRSWEDDKIVISGFSGAYGSGNWKLAAGDQIEIAVWNPQSGQGPALFSVAVSDPPIQ